MTCEACGHEQDRGRFCGRCGARAAPATDAGAEGGSGPEVTAVSASGPSRWPVAVVVALFGLGVGVAVLGGGRGHDEVVASPQGPTDRGAVRASPAPPPSPAVVETAHGEPLFGEATGLVLLFDDGGSGGLALDLDTGAAERVELPGQRAGDQPFRLVPLGGRVAVGWDEVVSLAPGTFLPPRPLGEDVILLPAADPDQLWLVPLGNADGATWRLIAADGGTLAELPPLPGDEPVRGIPGGLAVRDEDGRLWRYDLRTRRVLLAAEPPAWIGDASSDRVVWCQGDPCRALTVSAADGTAGTIPGGDAVFSEDGVWLAPTGDRLAAVVMVDVGGGAVDRRLLIYDVASGAVLADAQVPLGTVSGAWSPDTKQFLAWTSIPGGGSGSPALLSRWLGGEIQQVDVRPLAGRVLGGFVPLFRHRAPTLVPGCPTSPTSREMGALPAWRGAHVHVAFPRSDAEELPAELWLGIPGAAREPVLSVRADRSDGSEQAAFRSGSGAEWHRELTTMSGMRIAADFPPHWAFASRFPSGGCWVVSVLADGIADSVTMDLG